MRADHRAVLPSLSVVIPAFNEADYITETLRRLLDSKRALDALGEAALQVIVVDNASTDATAELARAASVTVVFEPERNIARARNVGAAAASRDVLVFVDADTLVPPSLLPAIARAMADPACIGGAVDAVYRPCRRALRVYLALWRALARVAGMAQGACQFCRTDVFTELNGYDETQFMGEDVDFFWRMKRLARRTRQRMLFLRTVQVQASSRRFDRWPMWRTLVWTNPMVAFGLRHRKNIWDGWYKRVPR